MQSDRIISDWERDDAYACWLLGVRLQREQGLREGRLQPRNEDERRIAGQRK